MERVKLGFALCGSFCTFAKTIEQMESLTEKGFDIFPIMSERAYSTDTRFGKAAEIVERIETLCGREVICTVEGAEPIGPKKLLDVLLVEPCTGNTLAKLASGITDSAVTMACKSHLRNNRPVVLAVSTNDALGNSAKNIGALLNYKNIYCVPMKMDAPSAKPKSVVADFTLTEAAVTAALQGEQLQILI